MKKLNKLYLTAILWALVTSMFTTFLIGSLVNQDILGSIINFIAFNLYIYLINTLKEKYEHIRKE